MRVYHFVNATHGLSNIRRRRLKIATLNELNDPFEFLGIDLHEDKLRRVLLRLKTELAREAGRLCFSRRWHNPVMWSHYARSHTGLCLGFDVPDEYLSIVNYTRRRVILELGQLKSHSVDRSTLMQFLYTKYSHWRYEAEVRVLIDLQANVLEDDKYFATFDDTLRLAAIIVGAESTVTRGDLTDALGKLTPQVEIFKARLAFRSFLVTRQRRDSLSI